MFVMACTCRRPLELIIQQCGVPLVKYTICFDCLRVTMPLCLSIPHGCSCLGHCHLVQHVHQEVMTPSHRLLVVLFVRMAVDIADDTYWIPTSCVSATEKHSFFDFFYVNFPPRLDLVPRSETGLAVHYPSVVDGRLYWKPEWNGRPRMW